MTAGVIILLSGLGLLGAVIGVFYLKNRLRSPTLSRLAYSEFSMRIAVIGAALIAVGVMLVLGNLFG